MWSGDPRTIEIGNAVINDGHSGASMAMCMRECQYLLKKEKENEMVIVDLEDGEIPETDNTIAEKTSIQRQIATPPTLQRQSTTTHLNYIDETNKKAIDVAATHGWDAAIEHMLTKEDGTPRTYSEMRALYG
jgi:FMN-dependent NADH-azoreductase